MQDVNGAEEPSMSEEGAEADTTPLPDLPDLLSLDLAELRTLRHPVLSELVAELRDRAEQPTEMLWGFTSAL
ncbi:FxSxx-COOH cyclophane-containing RiPP peptide [Streptomyces sp. FIT100]|uniref:FxSxx-COOH cyclophane-containing RiPP peptide n=1 Tax=Streptomyces sp. FIT100 TaxID=2837956 RepID=UPI0037D9CC41